MDEAMLEQVRKIPYISVSWLGDTIDLMVLKNKTKPKLYLGNLV